MRDGTGRSPRAGAGVPSRIREATGNKWSLARIEYFLAGVTAVVSLVDRNWGGSAAVAAAALAGAFDVHAAATSVLSLAADGKLAAKDVSLPVLVAFSTNAFMKGVAAFAGGGRAYGVWVVLGIVFTVAAAWLPFLLFR